MWSNIICCCLWKKYESAQNDKYFKGGNKWKKTNSTICDQKKDKYFFYLYNNAA